MKVPMPQAIRTRALRMGDHSTAVRSWQMLLVSKGFVLDVDGDFGPQTLSATKVAQAWAGAYVDGYVGPDTWTKVEAKTRSARPATTIKHIFRPPGVAPRILDVRAGQLGFAIHRSRRWGVRPESGIIAKLGHYTGGPASFQSDSYFHVHSDYLTAGGAPAIAYHLGVDKDGTLFVFNDWRFLTWHCDGGKNAVTLGVVFRGASEGPSLAQRRTLSWLWGALAGGSFRPFSGERVWPKLVTSTTHRHVNATSCPGEIGEAFYRSISGGTFRTVI